MEMQKSGEGGPVRENSFSTSNDSCGKKDGSRQSGADSSISFSSSEEAFYTSMMRPLQYAESELTNYHYEALLTSDNMVCKNGYILNIHAILVEMVALFFTVFINYYYGPILLVE